MAMVRETQDVASPQGRTGGAVQGPVVGVGKHDHLI